MTPTDYLATLEARRDLFAAKEKAETDTYARGLYAGWKAATMEAIRGFKSYLEELEPEPPYASYREFLLAQEFGEVTPR